VRTPRPAPCSTTVEPGADLAAMGGVLERAAEFFLAPPAAQSRDGVALPPAVRAVVLGSPQDASPLAAALALGFRAADRAPAAVVASWGGGGRMRPSAATRATARLAARLTAHGLPAAPRGRLAWLTLAGEPAEAAAAVRRASALVDGPLVTALGGARPAELEALVAEHDLAVVASEPASPLARAAVARLAGQGVTASSCPALRRAVPRALALAGLAAPRLDAGISPARSERPGPGGR
jgi:hypothetical protein